MKYTKCLKHEPATVSHPDDQDCPLCEIEKRTFVTMREFKEAMKGLNSKVFAAIPIKGGHGEI